MPGNDHTTTLSSSDLEVGGMPVAGYPVADAAIAFFDVGCDPTQLRREASALHRAAFSRDISEEVARRYAEAHAIALPQLDISQRRWMRQVLENGADLEAIEFALRKQKPDHVLCQKLKLLIYITEAFPEYYADFVNEAPRRASAFWWLALHGLRTLCKRFKARRLLRRLV